MGPGKRSKKDKEDKKKSKKKKEIGFVDLTRYFSSWINFRFWLNDRKYKMSTKSVQKSRNVNIFN